VVIAFDTVWMVAQSSFLVDLHTQTRSGDLA